MGPNFDSRGCAEFRGHRPQLPLRPFLSPSKHIKKNTKSKKQENTLVHCWWECKMVQPAVENRMQFLKKLKIELPYDPAILLLGIYPKELKAGTQVVYPCS